MMDNQVAIMEYRNGIRVQFQATMSNAIPERRMYFSCTEGTMILELYASTIRYRGLGDSEVTKIDYSADGHGGGDDHIMKEFYTSMVENSTPKCGGDEGLESAVVALCIDRAIRERTIVDLEPIWNGLNR